VNALDPPQKMAKDLLAMNPDVVTGYNGLMARVGQIIVADLGRSLPVRFVVGGADMLTPLILKHIEAAFQSPVYDHYGCQEFGLLASQCRASGLYHICDDSVILEVLKDGRPAREGERGEAVVTGLHLRAMPFIRYRLDDLVTVGPAACPCGRNTATLKSIEAKKQDCYQLPGGREFYPWSIILVLLEVAPWIMQVELVQEKVDRVVMRAEARPAPSLEEISALRDMILPMLGPDVEFDIEIVPQIQPGPGGKFWIRRSLVNSYYEGGDEAAKK
jgi:phenylacetate-CoA ligase